MSEKTNQKRINEYLVGDKGYLTSDLSNGKVIMLSGKWGSGKTHFWQNIIEKRITDSQTKKQKAYVYSSLYGNRSLDKIEDNIYAQSYLCSVGGKNAVISGYEKVKDFGKRFGSFCSLLDVSKLVDGLDDIQQKNIKRSALSYLENGGIICFDDFERKSKDIDLNDLFGFISHLAIDLKCKVVIILNDDVFEDEEKKIFSNVKEKSVSKFLMYNPSIEELFDSIFDNDERYRRLDDYKEIILKTIKETEELNARIYIQVFDNLWEWVDKKQDFTANTLRCLILVSICFILHHRICLTKQHKVNQQSFNSNSENFHFVKRYIVKDKTFIDEFEYFYSSHINQKLVYSKNYPIIDYLKKKDSSDTHDVLINQYRVELSCIYFGVSMDINNGVSNQVFTEINNFIETGILIDE